MAARYHFLIVFTLISLFSSCRKDDIEKPQSRFTDKEVLENFRAELYDTYGDVAANKMDDYVEGEWNLVADDSEKICEFFGSITGMDIPLVDVYDYTYKSKDGKFSIQLKGRKDPVDNVFAVLYVNIPECPEIKVIHLVTLQYVQ